MLPTIKESKISLIKAHKCIICGKPRWVNNSKYCKTCSKFSLRMIIQQFPHNTREAVWDYVRKHGYVCYYTRMPLVMTDPHSPWYCVFDHWIPHDSRKVVITSSLFNDMKSDLSEKELWYLIKALADFKRKHKAIRKIKLKYWGRDYERLGPVSEARLKKMLGKQSINCIVCGQPILHRFSRTKYCRLCARYIIRMKEHKLPATTIKDTCRYIHKNGYKCYYTGLPLEVNDSSSPWYCVLDHWIPHDPGRVVLTSAVVNDMKSDLSEKEFWYYIEAFADYKRLGKPVKIKDPVYWYRLNPNPRSRI